jgi:Uma2 family endonuclease
MGGPAKRATYADLAAVPSHRIAEILNGVLHVNPRPSPKHARASSSLGTFIGGPFDHGQNGPGGWWILDEPELHLKVDDVLVPDLAGWRVERMPELPETPYFSIPPDWVCEVLSPSTEAVDRAEKMPIYAEAAVNFAWLVDPLNQTLEVHRREGATWLLVRTFKGEEPVRAEPFDAVEFALGSLWAKPVKR